MEFQSIDDIINYAIEREKEAVAFYKELSDLETFSATKELLLDFSNEEKKHQTMLENFKTDGGIKNYKYEWIDDIKRSDYLVDMEYEKGMSTVDILRIAMKREEKAMKLYNDLIQKADNDDVIKVFQMLAQEEAKHKGGLETIYDDHMAAQGD